MSKKFNFAIVGSGPIGNMLSALLGTMSQSADNFVGNVYQLVRNFETRNLIKERGIVLTIQGDENRMYDARPTVVFSLDEIQEDYILIPAMKAYDLPGFLESINKDYLKHLRAVVLFQNGIGNEELTQEFLNNYHDPAIVVSGTITLPVEKTTPNKVTITKKKGGFGFAPFVPFAESIFFTEMLVNIFVKSEFKAKYYDNWEDMKWTKMVLNILFNAATIVAGEPDVEKLLADWEIVDSERKCQQELFAVIKKKKLQLVSLPGYPSSMFQLLRLSTVFYATFKLLMSMTLPKGRGGKPPSFWFDREKGRTEAPWLNRVIGKEYCRLLKKDFSHNLALISALNEKLKKPG